MVGDGKIEVGGSEIEVVAYKSPSEASSSAIIECECGAGDAQR